MIKKRREKEDEWVWIIDDSDELKVWTDAEHITHKIFKRRYASVLVIEEVAEKLCQVIKREVDLAMVTLIEAMKKAERSREAKAAKAAKGKENGK